VTEVTRTSHRGSSVPARRNDGSTERAAQSGFQPAPSATHAALEIPKTKAPAVTGAEVDVFCLSHSGLPFGSNDYPLPALRQRQGRPRLSSVQVFLQVPLVVFRDTMRIGDGRLCSIRRRRLMATPGDLARRRTDNDRCRLCYRNVPLKNGPDVRLQPSWMLAWRGSAPALIKISDSQDGS
jgi:hypothetical protein